MNNQEAIKRLEHLRMALPLPKNAEEVIALEAAIGAMIPPPNDPLTLAELREMDGEPVWISYFAGGPNVCMLVDAKHDVCRDAHGVFAVFENLGRTWIAYRRKPEEGER